MVGTLVGIIEALVPILSTIYFTQLSKEYLPFASLTVITATISLLMMLRMPESPLFLLTKGRKEEAFEIMREIAGQDGRHL